MLRNATHVLIEATASKKNMEAVEDLITSQKTTPVVKERALDVLGYAAHDYTNGDRRHPFAVTWRKVKPRGAPEQVRDPALVHGFRFSPFACRGFLLISKILCLLPKRDGRPFWTNCHQFGGIVFRVPYHLTKVSENVRHEEHHLLGPRHWNKIFQGLSRSARKPRIVQPCFTSSSFMSHHQMLKTRMGMY